MVPSMTLTEKETGDIVAVEKTASLEGNERLMPFVKRVKDMTSFIEVLDIQAGRYLLEIEIPRAYFLSTSKFPTCLGFDLVVEYIVRDEAKESQAGVYDVLSVRPLDYFQLRSNDEKVIEVEFDKPIVMDDLVKSLADRYHICRLEPKEDTKSKTMAMHPNHVEVVNKQTLRLTFDFKQYADVLPVDGGCFFLKCSTDQTKGKDLILPMQQDTNYCFESPKVQTTDIMAKCNPFADPKLGDHEECICAEPYTGSDCENCKEGFAALHMDPSSTGDGKAHTRCVLDVHHVTGAVCNDHGKPSNHRATTLEEVTCDCDKGFGGKYCDYCEDPTYAYPDCTGEFSSQMYDPETVHDFLSRRHYDLHGYSTVIKRYFKQGDLEPTVFNEECAWVDFPDDLDRVELGREFLDGGFHIADLYTVNHKQDNIMKFTPKKAGTFKVLVQQPEVEEVLAS
jgi:hypothetical protein